MKIELKINLDKFDCSINVKEVSQENIEKEKLFTA